MEFDLIYPNYNKQKRKQQTNKKTWLTTTEVQPYLHSSRFDVGKKHKYTRYEISHLAADRIRLHYVKLARISAFSFLPPFTK